jgi:hypothetical protein
MRTKISDNKGHQANKHGAITIRDKNVVRADMVC